jgi:hypothetical protein
VLHHLLQPTQRLLRVVSSVKHAIQLSQVSSFLSWIFLVHSTKNRIGKGLLSVNGLTNAKWLGFAWPEIYL